MEERERGELRIRYDVLYVGVVMAEGLPRLWR
jgi:hypothetical protein